MNGRLPENQHDGTEFPDRAGESERHAGEDRRQQVRKDDPAEDRQRARPERGRGLLHLGVELEQYGLNGWVKVNKRFFHPEKGIMAAVERSIGQ